VRPTCLIACVLAAASAARAQLTYVPPAVPPGFVVETLTEALSEPVGLALLPDGRALIVERGSGAIKVWAGGLGAPAIGVVPGVNSGAYERGLLAIAVDPQWPARPYVYVWYDATGTPNMRLSMFTVTGDVSNPASTNLVLGAQYDILTDTPDAAAIHNGGSLRFGPDGTLYLSIGDDGNPCAAQDINSGVGCIFRMDVSALPGPGPGPAAKTLLVPVGNPFSGPTDNARLVWCYGLRNPFRFHVDSVTGRVHIAEVGAALVDEIDESVSGGENFGWPWLEANLNGIPCGGTPPPLVHPITNLPHNGVSTAVMSFGRYRNAPNGPWNFGAPYEGDYLYCEYFSGLIRRLQYNGIGWIPAPATPGQPSPNGWGVGFQSVVDTVLGADGALYYVKQYSTHLSGALGRIRGNPNAQFVSIVSGDNQPGNAGRPLDHPLTVHLTDALGSPVAGQPITFAVAAGGGTVNPASVLTDSQGSASTSYTLAPVYIQPPVVTATAAGTSYVAFNVVWRGIGVVYAVPPFSSITAEVRHSQTNSPFTLAWEPPAPGPYLATPYGDVWTSVLAPLATFQCIDGLGLVGAPNPQVKTGPNAPFWTTTVTNLPPFGGVTMLFQAYAVDTSLYPAPEAFMISNTQVVTIL
jgi:glucose/arabinose dehydrogenase